MKKPFIYKYDSAKGQHILENGYGNKCFNIDITQSCYPFMTGESILGKTVKIDVQDIQNYDEFKEKFPELYVF